jgi:hypothetical protein
MNPNLLALLQAAAFARAAGHPPMGPAPVAAVPFATGAHPLALAAPRIGAPPAMRAPAMQAPIGPHAQLPVMAHPQHAMSLPRGARFRTPDGRVKVRP